MPIARRLAPAPLAAVLLALGCGSPAETSAASNTGGTGGAGGSGGAGGTTGTGADTTSSAKPPAVRFFVNDHPQDASGKEVEATEGRWGDPVHIVVEGMLPGSQMRVDISTGAWGVFAADAAGTIDLGTGAPLSGTWSKPDPDAWWWSAPTSQKLFFDIDVKVSVPDSGDVQVSGTFHRRPLNEGIEITKVNDGTRVGAISRPVDKGTAKAAILTFGGSEGGTSSGEIEADYLAQLGYVAFGVGYFGAAGLPADLEEVPLEILKDDLDYLASQPDVDPDRIGVLGGSRGGELALLLGATFPDRVRFVVADVPSGYVWGATSGKPLSAWSYGGMDLPYVPSSGAGLKAVKKNGKTYYAETPAFLADIAAAPKDALAAARIPVEKTQGPIFLSGGQDDQLWPSCVLAQVAYDALTGDKHTDKFADELHCEPDAGHFGTLLPGTSTQASDGYFSAQYNLWFLVGGTPEGNAHAQRANNTAMRKFLDKVLAP